jgi:MFS family permease
MAAEPSSGTTEPIEAAEGGLGSAFRLRAAFLVSSIGDWTYRFAVPTLILKITGSAIDTAFAYVLEFLPYIVVGLVAGLVADRWNRRRILVACDTSSFVITMIISGVATLHAPPIAALYGCALLLACIRPLYFPAFQGLLVDVVPEQKRAGINAWTQTTDSALSMAGPVAGTAIVGAAGVPLATLINALSFACSALLIYQIVYVYRRVLSQGLAATTSTLAGVRGDFADGMRLLWQNKAIRYGSGLMAAANLSVNIVEANLIYLVVRVEGLPKVVVGVIFGAQGLGAVAGAVLAPRLIDRYPAGRLLTYGMGGSAAAMLLPALVPQWWMMAIGWIFEGVATSIIIVSWFTERQRIVAPEAIGRVVSVSRAAAYATIPVGALLGGWLASGTSSLRPVFICAAAVQAAVFLGTAFSPVAQMNASRSGGPRPDVPDPIDSAS